MPHGVNLDPESGIDVGLEADEEADGGLRSGDASGDGEVILLEVGRKVEKLAEAEAYSERAVGEVPLYPGGVVIGRTVLEG